MYNVGTDQGLMNLPDVAATFGVPENTIRVWVKRGRLVPVNPHDRKGLVFRESDVWEFGRDRTTRKDRQAMVSAWASIFAGD